MIELPLADGGEGTLAVLAAAAPGSRWHHLQVTGPGTDQVLAAWLEMAGDVAVVELAAAAGLTLLSEPSPLTAHSYGVGELIGDALRRGARRIVVALGGSACTDGGTGALAALGARFLDDGGAELPRGGGALPAGSVDLTGLRPPPEGGVSCLTDVRAPLLGPGGAAAVFGPQKGASPADVAVLEARPGPAGRPAWRRSRRSRVRARRAAAVTGWRRSWARSCCRARRNSAGSRACRSRWRALTW